jgi:CBS-domain-containing membrane protein
MENILWHLGKLARIRFWYLVRHHGRGLFYLFIGLNNAVSIFFLGLVALWTSWPLIFPSLGPSLFLIFYAPSRAMSSPRNTLLGHLVAGVVGWLAFKTGQVLGAGNALSPTGILVAALAVGATGVFMAASRILHPPAASTALIAALGLMPHWYSILILGASCTIILAQALLIHRLAGVRYPLWAPFKDDTSPDIETKDGKITLFSSKGRPQDLSELAQHLVVRGRVDE